MKTDALRLFFALVPPPDVRRKLAALQTCLALPARRVPPANLHVTLAFLGRVDSDGLDALRTLAAEVRLPPCSLVFDRVGWYPRSRVGFARSARVPGVLGGFQRALVRRLREAGVTPDRRPWQPHVTLYRDLRTPPENMSFEPVVWRVNGFSLMRSETGPEGAKYQPLGRWDSAHREDSRRNR